MKKYTQLDDRDRHQMELLIAQGLSFRKVAVVLGRNPSTISREFCRGRTFGNQYLSNMTIRELEEKKKKARRKRKADNPIINEYIEKNLKNKYSPEIISSQIFKDTGCSMGNVHDVFSAFIKKAKINNFRFHDLRHTAATRMVERGIDLVVVKEILGHSNINTTMIYAHPVKEVMLKAVKVLNDY